MILQSRLVVGVAGFLNGWPVAAVTLWPFIFTGPNPNPITIQHERIHIAQGWELWGIGFYPVYGYYYLREWLQTDSDTAYALHPMEMEAYRYEREPGYLFERKRFAWLEFRC